MGNCCWTQCFGLLRKEAGRLQRVGGGGGSKYFRTCSRGEHLTIEFENLVESDEGESPGSSHRPLTEEEIVDLRERHYDSIAEKQKDLDKKIQKEQERQRIVQQYHPSNNGEYQSSGPEDDFESCLRNIKSQYEVFRSSRMNRMLPVRERSKTEEDILRAALKYSNKKTGSNPTSASDDSNGLEWENDFVSAEMDDNGNSEYSGFVNPVLELSDSGIRHSDTDQQTR
ncbi:AP-1 complex-associated regulatory protein isoform X4 [Macaca fascicularis]|uniref:AP-1 complex-associated regulatory protein isoform X4 n=1 Tax=Macaca fascicularis TaxID=9541 RepID=UPI003D15426D